MTTTPYIVFNGKTYFFKKKLGILFCKNSVLLTNKDVCHTEAYKYVENPYLLKHQIIVNTDKEPVFLIRLYAHVLVFLCKYAYTLIWGIRYFTIPIYNSAGEANVIFYKLFPEEQQRMLCLPRAIFTATMSKQFKKHGTLFIGAFLPLNRLHAWVIENGMHADAFDRQWIQYAPILEWSWRKKS